MFTISGAIGWLCWAAVAVPVVVAIALIVRWGVRAVLGPERLD